MVNTTVQPGTYRNGKGASGCYWARLSGTTGSLDEIIANGNVNGPAVISIAASDVAFTSQRCGKWSTNLAAVTSSPTAIPGDGMYIVNTDIQPGTYASTGGDGCYYARLSGFGGTLDEILANDNVTGPTVVTILPTDVGFESNRCGSWAGG